MWRSVHSMMLANQAPDFERRRLLRQATALPFLGGLAGWAGTEACAATPWQPQGVLVLIELAGGNDGLNMIVPYSDPAYAKARPNLAIPRQDVLQIDERLGFNKAMQALWPIWEQGDLALFQGVGYAEPNRSHFRSIEIWETASQSDETRSEGWISALFRKIGQKPLAVALGGESLGPLAGEGLTAVSMTTPEQFLRQIEKMSAARRRTNNPGLAHILRVSDQVAAAGQALSTDLAGAPALKTSFSNRPLSQHFKIAAQLIISGAAPAIVKITQTGYDTHRGQKNKHNLLLKDLAEGLAAFRQALMRHKAWDKTLVMTYGEFGRRVTENASAGTDHGTAAPHLVLGGTVRGGSYGRAPSLTDLEGGDLKYTGDFKAYFATVAKEWWHMPEAARNAVFGPQRTPNLLKRA